MVVRVRPAVEPDTSWMRRAKCRPAPEGIDFYAESTKASLPARKAAR
jgi:hypothetical protein